MTTQLRRLLFLQELDSMIGDLVGEGGRQIEEGLGFTLGPPEPALERRALAASSIDPQILKRYEQLRRRHPRAVAAVRGGVCLGCFTKRPTRTSIRAHELETCERCGRILFRPEPSL